MEKLKHYKLSELYEMSSGISTKKEQAGHGAPFLSFRTVFNNCYIPNELEDRMDTSEQEQNIFSVKKGDVFLTRTSETIDELGMSSVALKDYPNATYSGFLKRLRPLRSDITYDRYMAFYFRSAYFRKTMNNNASMTLRASLNEEIFSYITVALPDYEIQVKIGDFLYSIEEKIRNNSLYVSELESMAKDIYDYWFVQFDFPDENGKPYKFSGGKMVWNEELKREIPEGWSNCTLEKLVNIVRGVTYEEGDTVDRSDKDHIMLLRANNIANEKINLDKVTFVSKDRVSAQQILIPGDILICMSSGSKEHVGKTAELPFDEKMTFGAFCSRIICNDDNFRSFVNRTIKSNLFNAWVKQKALGTNINNLTNEIISSMPIVYPTKQIISRFHTLLCPIISKIYSVAKESRELTSLRDFLLPLLMNGQVKIGDMEP